VTRAVIELSDNISFILPKSPGKMENSENKAESCTIYIQGICVLVEPLKLTIYNTKDEEEARATVDLIKERLYDACETGLPG
jgi:hypothetical protein